jgi:DNA-binding CsgD family transcriptional regulator
LTAREREIAAHLGAGETNRQIAAALVISERTVDGHVANILRKLGFRTRSQIAAWVASEQVPSNR